MTCSALAGSFLSMSQMLSQPDMSLHNNNKKKNLEVSEADPSGLVLHGLSVPGKDDPLTTGVVAGLYLEGRSSTQELRLTALRTAARRPIISCDAALAHTCV